MFNVLLDALPDEWDGYPVDTDFRIGIQISQCLVDDALNSREKVATALSLLFPNEQPPFEKAMDALQWWLSEYDHDNHERSKGKDHKLKVMDFDADQWRIYAAFLKQYGIDLNTVDMHWFTFMGLLSNLEECNFTRVVDIRLKEIPSKASPEEKKRLRQVKKIYSLAEKEEVSTEEDEQNKEAQEAFLKMLGKK